MAPSIFKYGRFLLLAANDEKDALRMWPSDKHVIKELKQPHSFFKKKSGKYLLAVSEDKEIHCDELSFLRLMNIAAETGSGIVYSDFMLARGRQWIPHPLIDYQEGSIRSDFNFGHLFLFSTDAIKHALHKYGALPCDPDSALYDLRLKISLDHSILHIPEVLYTVDDKKTKVDKGHEEEAHFAYVAAQNFARQKKLEKAATHYLKLAGVYLAPRTKKVDSSDNAFPVPASVVIPVLNRKKTIKDALKSVLTQNTNFDFNIIVVDNHSTDGTTEILKMLAAQNNRIRHIIPRRRDLNIGGCWNEAIYSPHCGRYVVQLDSDDLYSSPTTMQIIVDTLRRGKYAMVVGSYTIVNEHLQEIPPGLIDHREWSQANGHNNLLRVNGLGAPRAFDTAVIRSIGFPNVSYGEDYAVGLRITREYKIGRIYESLYLCRRWSDNTDAGLSVEKQNHNDLYKDKLRTIEIKARQQMNE